MGQLAVPTESSSFQMGPIIGVNSKTTLSMVMENLSTNPMGPFILVIGKMINLMEKVLKHILIRVSMKDNSRMVKNMDKVSTLMLMAKSTKVLLLMGTSKE